AEEDRKRREAADVRNNADNIVYQAEKTLGELGDKVSAEDKEQVEKDIEAVKEALKGDDTDRIKGATDTLMQSFQRVGQAVYQQAQQEQAAAGGDAGQAGPEDGDDVVEGEVVDEGGAS
ncbi:MAG: Hsp70 family protein, partial [Actinomycetota bacterium]